jgi:xanthine dehydrogenase accessory factor
MIDSASVNATQHIAIAWLGEDRRFVQALLVEVEGSAPLPVGAMMLVDERGNIEGSITGGCVEGAVVEEAEAILHGRAGAKLLRYGISDELAGTVGLMCGGIVHIFVCAPDDQAGEVERAALKAHAEGCPVAIATLLDGETAGARLAIIRCPSPGDHSVRPPAPTGEVRAGAGGPTSDRHRRGSDWRCRPR